jgi:hypothetical protein
MRDIETQRTLVKSVPELWAELSETSLLGRMLAEPFGEIAITRRTPESSIEWASEVAAGSVELRPSGFGTRVRLTVQLAQGDPPPVATPPHPPGLIARLLGRFWAPAPPAPEAEPEPATGLEEGTVQKALTAVLDEIGAARHRPFSRHPGVGAH